MGRPELSPDEAKSEYVRVRVTKAQRKEIKRRAKAAKAKTTSAWIIGLLLGGD